MGAWENNVKFHKNFENTVKIVKISCVRCHCFVKFDIRFLEPSKEIFFGVITSITLEKYKKKECDVVYIILVQGFCPLKIKITQFPDGFRLNFSKIFGWFFKCF